VSHSFIAYIDESGHEADRKDKSSEWFVLSAVVLRAENDAKVCRAISSFRKACGKKGRWRNWYFKFTNRLSSWQKIIACEFLARKPVRIVHILVHKSSKPVRNHETNHALIYSYAGKFLLERISFVCRDHAHLSTTGNGKTLLVFSKRSEMNYDNFRQYVRELRDNPGKHNTRIVWDHIDPDPQYITARSARDSRGCQLADIAAGALFTAVNRKRDKFQVTDDRPIRVLEPVTYRKGGLVTNNGVKFWPPEVLEMVSSEKRFTWYRAFYATEEEARSHTPSGAHS